MLSRNTLILCLSALSIGMGVAAEGAVACCGAAGTGVGCLAADDAGVAGAPDAGDAEAAEPCLACTSRIVRCRAWTSVVTICSNAGSAAEVCTPRARLMAVSIICAAFAVSVLLEMAAIILFFHSVMAFSTSGVMGTGAAFPFVARGRDGCGFGIANDVACDADAAAWPAALESALPVWTAAGGGLE